MSTRSTTTSRGLLKSLVYVDMQRRKRMLKREAWAFVILAHAGLALAWALPGTFQTSSSAIVLWTWAMMLLRVAYFHIGLLLLLVALIAAAKRRWPLAISCLPLVLLTVLWPCLNFRTAPPAPRGPLLKVISANLLMINHDTAPILYEIESVNADVVFPPQSVARQTPARPSQRSSE